VIRRGPNADCGFSTCLEVRAVRSAGGWPRSMSLSAATPIGCSICWPTAAIRSPDRRAGITRSCTTRSAARPTCRSGGPTSRTGRPVGSTDQEECQSSLTLKHHRRPRSLWCAPTRLCGCSAVFSGESSITELTPTADHEHRALAVWGQSVAPVPFRSGGVGRHSGLPGIRLAFGSPVDVQLPLTSDPSFGGPVMLL
jgi:hypothetical protein